MSKQPDCNANPDKTLYREPHSPAIGSFDDKLFVTLGGGIGIDVAGMVTVRSLQEWHGLEAKYEKYLQALRSALGAELDNLEAHVEALKKKAAKYRGCLERISLADYACYDPAVCYAKDVAKAALSEKGEKYD